MRKAQKNNAFAVIISAIVIALLVLAGPAQGFILSLSSDKTIATQGEKIKFTADIDIDAAERLPIEYLTLELSGPETQTCKFNTEGTLIGTCKGITIQRTRYPQFNYGYGYGYAGPANTLNSFGYGYGFTSGKLTYEITVDTTDYLAGLYSTGFDVKIKNKMFYESGPSITIKQSIVEEENNSTKHKSNGGCFTSWICSDWSVCENGVKTRSCVKDVQYCYAGPNPEISSTCEGGDVSSGSEGNEIIQLRTERGNTTESNVSARQLVSRITGAVTGLTDTTQTNSDSILILATMMVLVLAILTLLLLIRRVKVNQAARLRQKPFY